MQPEQIIEKTQEFVKQKLEGMESGHAYDHIERVYKISKNICRDIPEANQLVVELGALLHDIADHKFYNGDMEIGPKIATEFLQSLSVSQDIIDGVVYIIRNISFKGAKVTDSKQLSLECQIVQDADRLDAIGAIGIARTFNYGGHKGRAMYDPLEKPVLHTDFEQYKNNKSCTINHFYEKLLLLKDMLNTPKAKELAKQRHQFMEQFLEQFFNEWEGKV